MKKNLVFLILFVMFFGTLPAFAFTWDTSSAIQTTGTIVVNTHDYLDAPNSANDTFYLFGYTTTTHDPMSDAHSDDTFLTCFSGGVSSNPTHVQVSISHNMAYWSPCDDISAPYSGSFYLILYDGTGHVHSYSKYINSGTPTAVNFSTPVMPFLGFPLDCSTPTCSGSGNIFYLNGAYTSQSINSVLDHNMTAPYSEDETIVSFTGETFNATETYPSTAPQPCYPKENDGVWSELLIDIYKGTAGSGSSNCTDEVSLNYDGHPGYDYKAATGTPVKAAAAGTVITFGEQRCIPKGIATAGCEAWGAVSIDHGNGYFTQYLHMSDISVEAGDPVSANDQIGLSGNTSPGSLGAHLHFEILKQLPNTDGTSVDDYEFVDPYGWKGEGTDPLETSTGIKNTCLWIDGC